MKVTMNKQHPQWNRFIELLEGSEGCDFREDSTWKCKGGKDKSFAKNILSKYFPDVDIPMSERFFEVNGGFCDCEICFNVV